MVKTTSEEEILCMRGEEGNLLQCFDNDETLGGNEPSTLESNNYEEGKHQLVDI